MAPVNICVFNPVTTYIDQVVGAVVGPGVAGQPVVLNSTGLIDPSLFAQGISSTIAGQTLNPGNLVNLYSQGGVLHAQLAYAQTTPPAGYASSGAPYPLPAMGFVSSQIFIGGTGSVSFSGTFIYLDGHSEFSTSSIGDVVYLSYVTPGGVTLTPPTGSPPTGELTQAVGYVVGFTAPNQVTIVFSPAFLTFSQITGILPISKGGTSATTGSAALINLIGGSPLTGNALVWNGTAWVAGTAAAGTIGGSITANQVAYGTASNTIGGSSNLTYASGTLTVTQPSLAHTPVVVDVLLNSGTLVPAITINNAGATFPFSISRGDSITSNPTGWFLGNTTFDSSYIALSDNDSAIYLSSPVTGLVVMPSSTAPPLTVEGSSSSQNASIKFLGFTSGSAVIQVSTLAGTPNPLQLPTATGAAGDVLITNGSNPQQLSWVYPGTFAGPAPWIDVTYYGARPLSLNRTTTGTTATINATTVNLGSIIDFQPGDGLVIYQAGVVGPNNPITPAPVPTPAQPSVTVNSVTGVSSISYQIVGADEYGALSIASAATTVHTAPLVFGNLPVLISSISQSSGVVTVNTATPISAVVGQQVLITNISNALASPCTFNYPGTPTVITATNSFVANIGVEFTTTGTLPTGISASTVYYVLSTGLSSSHFEVSATVGGSAISVTANGTGTITATGLSAGFNGYYAVASAPTTSQFTYALAGNLGAGVVSGDSRARLVNTYNITAITRTGTTITVTTNANHNFHYQSSNSPYLRTIAVIQGIDQQYNTSGTADLNGQYVILSASGSTVTLDSALEYATTETGVVTGTSPLQPTITVYEYITVTCPLTYPEPVFYYIYANYGAGYQLIGKTLPWESVYTDYGPWLNLDVGYPAYVPTGTPPAASQNRLYAGVITNLSGTIATVTPAIPTVVTGATVVHDNSVAITAAMAVANAVGGGSVYFPASSGRFILNYPIFMPANSSLSFLVGSPLTVNESIENIAGVFMSWGAAIGVSGSGLGQFEQTASVGLTGLASPMLFSYNGPLAISNLSFYGTHASGQTYVNTLGGGGENFSAVDCNFSVGGGQSGTSVPIILQSGNGYQAVPHFTNCTFVGYFYGMGNGQYNGAGSINLGPAIPLLSLRADEYGNYAPNGLILDGNNTFAGRGILFDGTQSRGTAQADIAIYEYEAPTTPTLMLIGENSGAGRINLSHFINDSQPGAIVANWGVFTNSPNMTIDDCHMSGTSSEITGSAIPGITFKNVVNVDGAPLGQNFNYSSLNAGQGLAGAITYALEQGTPIIMVGTNNNPIGWPIPPITGVTASISGVGTIASGLYYITITSVGWNNQEGAASSQPVTTITLNGSQGAAIGWSTLPGVQGYNVYAFGGSSFAADSPIKQNGSLITTNSYAWTTLFNNGAYPGVDSTGLPMLDKFALTVPKVRFYGSTSGAASIIASPISGSPNPMMLPTGTGTPGYVLTTDGGSPNQQLSWTANAGGGGGTGTVNSYGSTFVSQTSVTILGTTHELVTADLEVFVWDSATGTRNQIIPDTVSVDSTTYNVTITFTVAQSGRIVLIGSGTGSPPSRQSTTSSYGSTFASQTSVTILGTTHALGTADLEVFVWDSATGTRNQIIPDTVSVDSTTYNVTVTFTTSQSGRIILIGA